jgi:site-specific recombinase XerD
MRACVSFLAWCDECGLTLTQIRPHDVGAYIEALQASASAPSVKQQLAAIRMLFDWLVVGQVMPNNPASSVRGPKHVVKTGIDRALIGLMVFSFARIGAALGMKVEDVFTQSRRLWVRLREKGGKAHAMRCHHNLETYLAAYIEGAGIAEDPKGPLFRTIGRGTGLLTRTPLPQANAYAMIGRRAAAAGIATKLGNHSFRATGITAYLKNGGTLEKAAQMANHASTRTTQLYDRLIEAQLLVSRWRGLGCNGA